MRPRSVNRRTQPRSPIQAANVAHGMRGPVTSSSADPTRQRSPTTAPSTSTPDGRQVLAEHPVAQVTPERATPPVELLARHGVHRLVRPAVVLAADDVVTHDPAARGRRASAPGRAPRTDATGRLSIAVSPTTAPDAAARATDVDRPHHGLHAREGMSGRRPSPTAGPPDRHGPKTRAPAAAPSGSVPRVTAPTSTTRQPTAVDAVAEAHFDAVVASSPMEATYLGVPGGETELDDLSPDGYAHHVQIARDTLARLDAVEPVDEVDRVTVAAMRERLGLDRRDARGRLRPDGAQRHRLAAAGLPRRLRPDAHRHPGRLGHHRHPPHQGADRPRAVDRAPCASRPTAGW